MSNPRTPPAGTPDPAAPNTAGAPSARTRVRRLAERACYDAATVEAIVDAAHVCHIAFTDESGVHCIPTACWRLGRHVYIHGSNGSRMLKALASGRQAALTITHLDGLVLARSAFNHTMNYRSLAVYGVFETVPDLEKAPALAAFLEHLLPGRQDQVRAGDANELAATTVLRLGLGEAAAKVRVGPPEDDVQDMSLPVWAGVLPLRLLPGTPEPDPAGTVDAPPHVQGWPARRFGPE